MDNSFFQFERFTIQKSFFELTPTEEIGELSVGFQPKGKLDYNHGKFHLELGIYVSDSSEALKIEIETIGYFSFEKLDRESLPGFLFVNAPAILFPYLRAYISSLTTLSGIRPIVLPTLNLINLKDDLASNIEETKL
ncbi:MAG: protein-export chaperone SecB [Flavobacteriaceae bacterium]|nr:protein-export chaperone SecB [Flavobacteriaceae bacterium]